MKPRAWAAGTIAALVLNYARHRLGLSTWCSTWRQILRTDTQRGRLVFIAGFCWFAYWFPGHFLKTPQAPTTPDGPDHA